MSRQGIPFKIGQTFAPLSILDRVRIVKITIVIKGKERVSMLLVMVLGAVSLYPKIV